MNEVIERMAKAAFEKFYGGWEEKPAWPPEYFDSELRSADDWRDAMRDVLRAMREPTDKMGFAGVKAQGYFDFPEGDSRKLSDQEAESVKIGDRLHGNPSRWSMPTWRAMIDEALRE